MKEANCSVRLWLVVRRHRAFNPAFPILSSISLRVLDIKGASSSHAWKNQAWYTVSQGVFSENMCLPELHRPSIQMCSQSLNPRGPYKPVAESNLPTFSENGQKNSFREEDILNTQRKGGCSRRPTTVAIKQVFWGICPQPFVGSREEPRSLQKLKERMRFLDHFRVFAEQYHAWLVALGMVAYFSSLLLNCYILLVAQSFSFPVPPQLWNRLWTRVGQGEGKLRVTVSLYSGAFSFSIKLTTLGLPVG